MIAVVMKISNSSSGGKAGLAISIVVWNRLVSASLVYRA
jgi:hypothetical protein